MKKLNLLCFAIAISLCCHCQTNAHEGPDPVAHWQFDKYNLKENTLKARLGPDITFKKKPALHEDELGSSIVFTGRGMEGVIAKDIADVKAYLPKQDMTVSAWVAIDQPVDFGAIMGAFQDNGHAETGWILGYCKQRFSFALSTQGADDGNGLMTYLTSKTEFELGKLYHVVAVYDGKLMQLYINGKLDSTADAQSGEIKYPESAPVVIGCYHDRNEFNPMTGRIREIAMYDLAATDKWVSEEFEHNAKVTELPGVIRDNAKDFVVKPFLQFGTQTEMTVVWRSASKCVGKVHWGQDIECTNVVSTSEPSEISQVRITGLKPETQYFYFVESENGEGQTIESNVSTFQTASLAETPFAFAVIGDTQDNPSVSGTVAELAWAHRPNFLLHAGDLVGQGKKGTDWIDEFFLSMDPLISRVPMFPVLGNHEQNAKNYFDYMALPDPEYYYQFSYGNSDFFMIDSNRSVSKESEQYRWLDEALSNSQATWKFVCHHHPPYSSDENDYGDLWKTNQSTRGDLRVRELTALYDRHGVDIVWNGHIHSYERTWPVKQNKSIDVGGTIYMITGGGGGGLETPGPTRPFFQNNVRYGHHYVMVAINGNVLELKAFGLDDKLFDSMKIQKD